MDKSKNNETVEFQEAVKRAAGWIGRFFENPDEYPVLSKSKPGQTRGSFPVDPPERGRPLDELLDDFEQKIVPGVTHWNHPSFFAYFSISGSYPGVLGELLAAALNVNGMLWRTSPALTELESLSLDYLLKLLNLQGDFFGQILDTASTSSLVAIAAAREALAGLSIREKGMAGRSDLPPLVLYTSEESHSSIDKAAIVLGIGTQNVRRIATDSRFRMDPAELARAVKKDEAEGRIPFCAVATVGTTSTGSVDPVPAVADVCAQHGMWLHVDAAYAWAAAILPEKRNILAGCDRADSIVVNPHKWLFTPIDLSVLFCRHRQTLKNAFTLVPEYLRTSDETELVNLMDYGFQLGRRFRALKLWLVINYYGAEGLRENIRRHIKLAEDFSAWVERHPDFEIMAPGGFSLVCFRFHPAPAPGRTLSASDLDRLNERLLENVNSSGKAFLSHTKINGRYSIRCAIGNIRTSEAHVLALQELLDTEAKKLV